MEEVITQKPHFTYIQVCPVFRLWFEILNSNNITNTTTTTIITTTTNNKISVQKSQNFLRYRLIALYLSRQMLNILIEKKKFLFLKAISLVLNIC